MSPTKTFLKNYLPTAFSIITHSRRFYQDMPVSGRLKEPLGFAVLTIFIVSLMYVPVMLISWAPYLSLDSDVVFTLIVTHPGLKSIRHWKDAQWYSVL